MTSGLPHKPRVLIVADWFPPSAKAGGPSRSLESIVRTAASSYDIHLITRDRDLGDDRPYEPSLVGHVDAVLADVVRLSPHAATVMAHFERQHSGADIIYLNSVFSPLFSLLPLVVQSLRRTDRTPVLLAPRGELAPAALALKRWKKRPIGWFVRQLVRSLQIVWHASSEREAQDIKRFMRSDDEPVVVRSDPAVPPEMASEPPSQPLTVAFVGRVVPIKNVELLFRAAPAVGVPLRLVIVGALEDRRYWQRCQRDLAGVGNQTEVKVMGHLGHEAVQAVLRRADVMVLPTRGENFGHAIAESMAVGCPVMIPDTTMWTPLVAAGAGWLIDTDDDRRLVNALHDLDAMPRAARQKHRQEVRDIYSRWWNCADLSGASLFDAALRAVTG